MYKVVVELYRYVSEWEILSKGLKTFKVHAKDINDAQLKLPVLFKTLGLPSGLYKVKEVHGPNVNDSITFI